MNYDCKAEVFFFFIRCFCRNREDSNRSATGTLIFKEVSIWNDFKYLEISTCPLPFLLSAFLYFSPFSFFPLELISYYVSNAAPNAENAGPRRQRSLPQGVCIYLEERETENDSDGEL